MRRANGMMPPASDLQIAIAGMLALAVGMGIGRFAFTPLLPMMQDDAGLSVAQGGWLASANYFGYLVGALSAMAIRVRAAIAIRTGFIVIGFATMAMAFFESFGAWVVLRAIAGIANAWVGVFAIAWSLERLPPGRPVLKGMVFAGVGLGIAGAGLLCLALMQAGSSSARAWLALGVLPLLLAAELWAIFGAGSEASPRADTGQHAAAGWDRDAFGLVLCFGAAGFGYIISATFLPVIARQIISDPALFGWSWPVFGAAAMAGTLLTALLSGRVGNRPLWVVSQLVMAAGVALPVFRPGLAAIMVSALAVGGTFMVITMASMQEARAAGGSHPTSLIAAVTAAFALGQIAGPIVGAHMAGPTGDLSGASLVAAILLAASTALLRRPDAAAGKQRTPSIHVKETFMKLYLNKTSPYARLVLAVASEKGMAEKIEMAWTDPWASAPELLAVNPYSKVPALVTDEGVAIVDSGCICDYLDGIGQGRPLMPPRGSERLRALRKYGLGRGLIDASFGVTIERRFHDAAGELPLADRWLAAIDRALELFERDKALLAANGTVDLGDLAIGVALSYTEFRLPEVKWRASAPALSGWFDRLAARPSMRASAG